MKRRIVLATMVPGLAWGQVQYSSIPHPVAPPGFGEALQKFGDYIATGYGSATCGFRTAEWAQQLDGLINDNILKRLKNQNETDDRTEGVITFLASEATFGRT